jgi:hypothetical protein
MQLLQNEDIGASVIEPKLILTPANNEVFQQFVITPATIAEIERTLKDRPTEDRNKTLLKATLTERITIADGAVQESNFYDYTVMRNRDVPEIHVEANGDPFGRAGDQQCCGGANRCAGPSLAAAAGTCAGCDEGVVLSATHGPGCCRGSPPSRYDPLGRGDGGVPVAPIKMSLVDSRRLTPIGEE